MGMEIGQYGLQHALALLTVEKVIKEREQAKFRAEANRAQKALARIEGQILKSEHAKQRADILQFFI